MSYPHWEYFLAIEADLASCTRYVEFHVDNYKTYSVEFARVLVAASSEFDAVAKALCKQLDQAAHPETISDYRPIIVGKYPRFLDYTIHVPRFKIELQPWKDWTTGGNPDWWSKGYNKIKHHRDQHFARANLENALLSVAGLLTGIVYLYDATYGDFPNLELAVGPKLFEPQDFPSGRAPSTLIWYTKAWK